jgi:flagellar motor switch protein FliN/FliY
MRSRAMELENLEKKREPGIKPVAEPKAEGSSQEVPNLDFILDLPLEVSVELGRARMLVSELLQLGQGSVIELNKLAGEPVEIFVNQKLIARGEVVVVNDKFGIKMTDILSPMERVKQLGS